MHPPPPGSFFFTTVSLTLLDDSKAADAANVALPGKKTAVWITGFSPAYGGLSLASCGSKTGKYCDLLTAAGLQVRRAVCILPLFDHD
jgi:hypothetical protein